MKLLVVWTRFLPTSFVLNRKARRLLLFFRGNQHKDREGISSDGLLLVIIPRPRLSANKQLKQRTLLYTWSYSSHICHTNVRWGNDRSLCWGLSVIKQARWCFYSLAARLYRLLSLVQVSGQFTLVFTTSCGLYFTPVVIHLAWLGPNCCLPAVLKDTLTSR